MLFLIGYVGLQIFDSSIKEPFSGQKLKNDIRHALIFLCFGLGLSPVLYKLTDTISTDTIYTTSGIMLFIHLVFHNYGLEKSAVVSKALSLNAGTKYSILVKYFLKNILIIVYLLTFFKFWRLLSHFLASDWLIHSAEQPIRSLQDSKKFTKKGEMVRLST